MAVFLFHSPSEPRNSPPAFILYRVDPITLARKLGCLSHDLMFLSVWASWRPLWARIPANFKLHLYQVLKVESSSFPSAVFSHLLPRKCPSYTMCVCVRACTYYTGDAVSNGIFAEAASAEGHGTHSAGGKEFAPLRDPAKVRSSQVPLVAKNPPSNAGDVRDVDATNGCGRFGGGLGDLCR